MWVLSPKNKQDYFLKCSHLLWGLQSSERQALWAGRLPPSLLPSLVCHPGVGRGCEGPAPASPLGGKSPACPRVVAAGPCPGTFGIWVMSDRHPLGSPEAGLGCPAPGRGSSSSLARSRQGAEVPGSLGCRWGPPPARGPLPSAPSLPAICIQDGLFTAAPRASLSSSLMPSSPASCARVAKPRPGPRWQWRS